MMTGRANAEQTSVGYSRADERQRKEARTKDMAESIVALFAIYHDCAETHQSLHGKKARTTRSGLRR